MDFLSAENQYRILADQCTRGLISYDQFINAVNQITVYDQSGRLWMIHPQSAKWCVYQGGQWLFQEPGKPSTPPQIPTAQIPPPVYHPPALKTRKKSPLLVILPVVLVVCLGLLFTGIFLAKKGVFSTFLQTIFAGSAVTFPRQVGNSRSIQLTRSLLFPEILKWWIQTRRSFLFRKEACLKE